MKGGSRGTPRHMPEDLPHVVPIGARLRFIVPLPSKALSPNGGHGNTYDVARAKGEYRNGVKLYAIDARNQARWAGPATRVVVSLVFMTKRDNSDPGYRPLDVANGVSAFKAGFDGLVDARLFPDDSHDIMSLGSVEIDPNSGPGVQITVEVI